MEKTFHEVLPDLQTSTHIMELLDEIRISRITMPRDRSSIRIYIECRTLIPKRDIYVLEAAIKKQISYLQKERGITVILVSHSMEDVARYVDRLIVMNQGEVRFDGTPKEVFRHYKELEEIGLAAPQVTYLMQELKEKGASVDTEATTVEEAAETIEKWLRQR